MYVSGAQHALQLPIHAQTHTAHPSGAVRGSGSCSKDIIKGEVRIEPATVDEPITAELCFKFPVTPAKCLLSIAQLQIGFVTHPTIMDKILYISVQLCASDCDLI